MKTILKFVTGNPNKIIEVNGILSGLIPVEPVALDIPEIQGTLEEIARDKCRRAAQIVRSSRTVQSDNRANPIVIDQWTRHCGRLRTGVSCFERTPWSIHVGYFNIKLC